MPDREKIIKALEICEKKDCVLCPYKDEKDETYSGFCEQVLKKDALALLKEQEAENVVNMTLSKDKFLIASCPKCNMLLTRVEHKNYCGYCGQAVKWE